MSDSITEDIETEPLVGPSNGVSRPGPSTDVVSKPGLSGTVSNNDRMDNLFDYIIFLTLILVKVRMMTITTMIMVLVLIIMRVMIMIVLLTEKVKEMIMLKMIMTILRSVMMTLIMIGERRDKRKASGRKDRI